MNQTKLKYKLIQYIINILWYTFISSYIIFSIIAIVMFFN